MFESLNLRQIQPGLYLPNRQKLIRAAGSFFLGVVFGFFAKHFDQAPIIGLIGSYLGVWIFTATLIAAWSRSPKAAALHVFVFFAGMLISYYVYSMILFGFFPQYQFLRWGAVALLSPIFAAITWFARGDGWIAALFASLPISLLLLEGYSFFYTWSIPHGFAVLAAFWLVILLGNGAHQRLRILMLSAGLFLAFRTLDIFSLVFGGL